jgi:hypothetical protein
MKIENTCDQYSKGHQCVLPLGHTESHETAPYITTDGPFAGEIGIRTWPNVKEWEGTSTCPICGVDSSHVHTSSEIAEFRAKKVKK